MARSESSPALVPEVATVGHRRLERLRRVGYLLDNSIPIPGTRFRLGIESLIGLVPGLGDIAGGILSLYIIAQSARLGAPRSLLLRMGWNVAVDTLVGEVPILGDLFDIGYKPNLRNLALLEGYLRRPTEVQRSSARLVILLATGLLLLTVGAIALAVVLLRFLDGLLKHGLLR
jgi:hypothetical protein